MNSMTPSPDNPSQKQLYLVLGDLLDLQLPEIDWTMAAGDPGLHGFINHSFPRIGDEEAVRQLRAYVDHFQVAARSIELGSRPVDLWSMETTFEGIEVHINTRLSTEYAAEHEPPHPALSPRADMYVRRSNGQLSESVTS